MNKPASAIVVEQPANNSWAVAIWSLQKSDTKNYFFSRTPLMKFWKSPDNWKLVLPFSSNVLEISRENDRVFVQEGKRKTGIRKY